MMYPLTALESIFRVEDIEGLLAAGCPVDEYDSEALEVHTALETLDESNFDPAHISSILAAVWQDSFGPFNEEGWCKRQAVLQRLVQRILDRQMGTGEFTPAQHPRYDNSTHVQR